ncbi:Detected protein of unknown function [Hibiscus syriacus]|uniref:Isopenicillin N synthase-like Fe(2+) 2OG dioxygenase domain-containing protein n=1 Tax=Hibiscus syriacus TaxID=106335 RepID=A0A6A2WVX8_HIBSY|nr:Detected protein of unknown function [Hibiscus syriacus]
MEGPNILQLYEIEYSDLMLMSSSSSSCSHYHEKLIMENLGPLARVYSLLQTSPTLRFTDESYCLLLASWLCLAAKAANDHNLGSDVPLKNPDRNVSSFAMQLKYDQGIRICMMEIGLCLARICDRHIGGNELEQSLLESCAAKGRLFITTQWSCEIHANLWQQWHYDYGIFTVLTDPVFLMSSHQAAENSEVSVSSDQECASPSGHSYLQVFHPNKNKVLMVKSSPESFIVQVGESADILSKGKLRSTLHCVQRPARLSLEHYNPSVQPLEQAEEKNFSDQEFSRETTKQYYGGSGLQSNK